MLEVKIPSEIRAYKGKLVAGLTVRQIFAVVGILVFAVPVGVFGRAYIPADILPWIIIIIVAPFAAFGWLKFKGMQFEEFAVVLYEHYFTPQTRIYEDYDENIFCSLREHLIAADVLEQKKAKGIFEDDEDEDEDDDDEELED